MLFYQINGVFDRCIDLGVGRYARRETKRTMVKSSRDFNMQFHDKQYIFVSDVKEDTVCLGLILCEPMQVMPIVSKYLKAIGLKVRKKNLEYNEVTLTTMIHLLHDAKEFEYIADDNEVLKKYMLDQITKNSYRLPDHGERLIDADDKALVYEQISHYLVKKTMLPELDRIYAKKVSSFFIGHPVHYMIESDDHDTRNTMYKTLIKALYANGRVASRRYCYLDIKPGDEFSNMLFDKLYASCIGATVVIRFFANDDSEDEYASSERETIEFLCETLKRYRNEVLTIICLPQKSMNTKVLFYECLQGISMIELKEEAVHIEEAKDFLLMLAKEHKIRSDKKLYEKLEKNETYLAPELHLIFDEWYSNKLKTSVFPQYKGLVVTKPEKVKTVHVGSAYDELMEMVGLSEAKKVMNQALDYFKAQALLKDKGIGRDLPSMHMVFTGNPGTAKTTAARLFARIMKDNGILAYGRCVEVGRGDLVGKYVGWTAQNIQKKFREAQGSVLFIDEAYSLVDDRDGSFGDEAINTIVQEMENHRNDTIVIFAGYPDKMEKFLKKNPGLRSRIAFHVPFEDYETEDLCNIARLIAKNKGLILTDDAIEKMSGIFEQNRTLSDFGNGRFVRNVIEKARMAQATRLLSMDFDSLKKSDVVTICAEDIEIPEGHVVKEVRRIGFCA